jgi:hypothetical protein
MSVASHSTTMAVTQHTSDIKKTGIAPDTAESQNLGLSKKSRVSLEKVISKDLSPSMDIVSPYLHEFHVN